MRRLCLAALCLCLGCASVPPRRASVDPGELAAADAAVLRGCYDCLLEARSAYERVSAGPERAQVLQRLFETYLLIALREREFALPESGVVDRARALVAELPATLEAARYLHLLENIPAEHDSWPRADLRAFRGAQRQFVTTLPAELDWLKTGTLASPVRRVLAMTLECTIPMPGKRVDVKAPEAPEDRPPLVRYRAAACGGAEDADWLALINDVPQFVEAQYFLGESALDAIPRGGGPDPRPLITSASARFPDAIAVRYLSARLQHVIGRCSDALPLLDRIIARFPEHENAWLGRTMCLTDLGQRQEAIDAATHIIDRRLDNMDDALYWRAWNFHSGGDLVNARADVDALRHIRVKAETLTLAGIIEHDQDDLSPAERDLVLATKLVATNCPARWFLGSVFVKKQDWTSAAPAFDGARTCFDAEADGLTERVAKLEADATLDADYRSAESARLRGRITVDRAQQRAAALNAAKSYAALGNFPKARDLVGEAAADPSLKADVDELLAWLDKRAQAAAAP